MSDNNYRTHYEELEDSDQYDDLVGKHQGAMTSEDLHGKAEIARELAYRDYIIDQMQGQLDAMMASSNQLEADHDACVSEQTQDTITAYVYEYSDGNLLLDTMDRQRHFAYINAVMKFDDKASDKNIVEVSVVRKPATADKSIRHSATWQEQLKELNNRAREHWTLYPEHGQWCVFDGESGNLYSLFTGDTPEQAINAAYESVLGGDKT